MRAELALVSVGADNDYGHPAPDVLAALEASGARWPAPTRTATSLVVADGEGVRLESSH